MRVYVPWGQEIMTRKCYDKEIPGHWDNGTNGLLAPLTLVQWVIIVIVVVVVVAVAVAVVVVVVVLVVLVVLGVLVVVVVAVAVAVAVAVVVVVVVVVVPAAAAAAAAVLVVVSSSPRLTSTAKPGSEWCPPDLDHKRLGEIECHNESEKTQ